MFVIMSGVKVYTYLHSLGHVLAVNFLPGSLANQIDEDLGREGEAIHVRVERKLPQHQLIQNSPANGTAKNCEMVWFT